MRAYVCELDRAPHNEKSDRVVRRFRRKEFDWTQINVEITLNKRSNAVSTFILGCVSNGIVDINIDLPLATHAR